MNITKKGDSMYNNIYKEEELSYEEFCEPFKKVVKVLKDKGITTEIMKKKNENSRRKFAKYYLNI